MTDDQKRHNEFMRMLSSSWSRAGRLRALLVKLFHEHENLSADIGQHDIGDMKHVMQLIGDCVITLEQLHAARKDVAA